MLAHVKPSPPLALAFAFALLGGACEPAPGPSPESPEWPPREGIYCGDSPSRCDDDGNAWVCGPRPLWKKTDCTQECEQAGLAHRGCLIIGSDDRDALASRTLPGTGSSTAIPEARCLCADPSALECAGPSHRVCADRSALLVCTDQLRWSKVECSSVCESLLPRLRADACVHGVGPGDSDACRCTASGAPCSEEGSMLCADDRVYSCNGGVLSESANCGAGTMCGAGERATCIFDGEAHCACIPD